MKKIGFLAIIVLVISVNSVFSQQLLGQKLKLTNGRWGSSGFLCEVENVYTKFRISFLIIKVADDVYDVDAASTGEGGRRRIGTANLYTDFIGIVANYLRNRGSQDDPVWGEYANANEIARQIGQYIVSHAY
jgi:hypothetical protein